MIANTQKNSDMIRLLIHALEMRDEASFELAMIQAHGYFEPVKAFEKSRRGMEFLTDGIIRAACDCYVPEMLTKTAVDEPDLRIRIDEAYLEEHDALPRLPEFGLRWSAEWAQKCINALNLARITESYISVDGRGREISCESESFEEAKAAALAAFANAEEEGFAEELCNEIRMIRINQWKCRLCHVRPVITSDAAGQVTAWVHFSGDDMPSDPNNPEWEISAGFLPEYPVKNRYYKLATALEGVKTANGELRFEVPHPEPELKDISAEEVPETEDLIRGYRGKCYAVLDRGTVL